MMDSYNKCSKKLKISADMSQKENKAEDFCFSHSPTLEDLRAEQAKFAEERNWNQYHTPRNLLLAMVGEVGELSELFQWRGEVQEGLPDWTENEREKLGHELSDVFLYLIRLAEKCRIDLPREVQAKLKLNSVKYPAEKVYGSRKKYTEYGDAATDTSAASS